MMICKRWFFEQKPHQNWPLVSVEIISYITRLDTQVLLCGVKTHCNVNWRTHFDIWCGMKKWQILWMNLLYKFRIFHGFLGALTKFGQIMWCPQYINNERWFPMIYVVSNLGGYHCLKVFFFWGQDFNCHQTYNLTQF
jgi:hypothetical protein